MTQTLPTEQARRIISALFQPSPCTLKNSSFLWYDVVSSVEDHKALTA